MTRFARTEVIKTIYERGLVPSFSALDPASGGSIVKACADGGARAILSWYFVRSTGPGRIEILL